MALFLFPALAMAQNTTVTATVTDPVGTPYTFATGYTALVCPGNQQPTYNGFTVPRTFAITGLDGTGTFIQVLYDVNLILPTGCGYQWHITWSDGVTAFITGSITSVTGSAVNESAAISAFSVLLPGSHPGIVTSCTTVGGVAYQNGSNNTLTCSGNLAWNNSSEMLTLSGPSTAQIALTNPNAATSLANADSPSVTLAGQAWLGGSPSSVTRTYTVQEKNGFLWFTQAGLDIPIFPYQFDNSIQSAGVFTGTGASLAFQTGSAGAVFAVTSVANAIGNLTTYTYTASGNQPSSSQNATIAGFVAHASNNGTFVVQSSTPSTITVYNSSGVAETHTATATVQTDYQNVGSGYGVATGDPINPVFPISGTSYPAISQLQAFPNAPFSVATVKGDSVDAAYSRIINDGSSGNHGLEIGAIIDSTGASPVTFQVGHFNGVNGVNLNGLPIIIAASLVTTAATSDNVTVTGMTASGHCTMTPTNAAASGLAAVPYISNKTTNQITVTHSVTANANFDILCTPY